MSSLCYYPFQLSTTPSFSAAKHIVRCNVIRHHTLPSVCFPLPRRSRSAAEPAPAPPRRSAVKSCAQQVEEDDRTDYRVLTAIKTLYNDIVILDTPESRMLLLDSTNNVHSVFNKGSKWTGSYWDQFATLPAIVPEGPVAIFGLGGGTAAHLLLQLWPSLELHGWEIDQILIDKARDYLGLSDVEKGTEAGGILQVHVGDALSSSASVPSGYAGIIVDLFSDGKVLLELEEVETWLALRDRLMPHGRIMVNCAGVCDGLSEATCSTTDSEISSVGDTWESNSTIKAMYKAFPGQLSWKKMSRSEGENFLALTGPFPDLTPWSDALPEPLSSSVKRWKTCSPS